jgi:class 3 adenylate cyclase/GAF domain-containing protein
MASTAGSYASLDEVRQLKALVDDVLNELRGQQEALKIRGMSLPPGTLQNALRLQAQIDTLEATLVEDERELAQLRTIGATSAMINSSLDLDTVLSGAMDEVINLTGAERGFLLLINPVTQQLEFRLIRNLEHDSAASASSNYQVSSTILNEVFTTGEPLLTDNAFKDPRMQDSATIVQYLLRSVLAVPLQYKDRVIGAVYVDNRFKTGVFTERELTLLRAFANQVAVAIENTRMFADVQAALADITEINELIQNVFASIGSGVITTDAADRILTYNQAAADMLRRPVEAALGEPLLNVLPPISGEFEAQLQAVREQDQRLTMEAQPDLPERGPVVLSMKLSPLKDANQHTEGVAMVLDDLTAQREREQALNVVRRYLPPGMVDNIHQISRLALGGERRDVTCLFAEVCPLTSFAPDLSAAALMELLNLYMTHATEAVHRANGLIDKYNGAEIMVLFNTQLNPQQDHARCAIEAALHLRQALTRLYGELCMALDEPYYRVGIHSGVATLGNVGSSKRRNFTAIGDTINLAKRLQENARPGQIILSEDTLRHAEAWGGLPDAVRLVERESIQAKGRQQRTLIFEVFEA